jgi:hypothetical protein
MSDSRPSDAGAPDPEALAWQAFVSSLGRALADAWPEMQQRLGEQHGAFVGHAAQQARQRGLSWAAAIARYVNLCCVWGPSFHERAGFEWAQGLLAAPPSRQWLTVHQLVRRSLVELERLPQARIDATSLARVDAALLDRFADLGSAGALRRPPPAPLPRAACDLEAVELRSMAPQPLQVYRAGADGWQREPLPETPPLRAALALPRPTRVALLAPAAGSSDAPTRLQVRLRAAATCDADHHPAVGFGGAHGRWSWRGHETRAVSFPVATLEQVTQPRGPGAAIAEETSPALYRLDLETCGLRDDGDAFGPQQWPVFVWPSTQWWVELRRGATDAQTVAAHGAPPAVARTRVRVEADGRPQDSEPIERAFRDGLDARCSAALQALAGDWAEIEGIEHPTLQGRLGLLLGDAAASWGWVPGATGLASPALMRVLVRLRQLAALVELVFGGELQVGGAAARITLRADATVPLEQTLQRETDVAPLFTSMQPLLARFRCPLNVVVEPLAADGGVLLQAAGPTTGALVGEAGLRPCTSGGSGWEWFAGLRVEAVSMPLALQDPVLGDTRIDVALLAARMLVDWSGP